MEEPWRPRNTLPAVFQAAALHQPLTKFSLATHINDDAAVNLSRHGLLSKSEQRRRMLPGIAAVPNDSNSTLG